MESRVASSTQAPIPLPVAEQAMHWLLELQAPHVSEQTRAHWLQWRQADALHEMAWQRAQAFSSRMSSLRSPGQRPLANAALAPMLSRRSALKNLALLLAAGGTAWSARDSALVQDWRSDFSSAVGERHTYQLADQVQVQLNTDSAIEVHFDPQQRVIRLLRGEILLNSATALPLWVDTAEGRVQMLGQQLAVRQRQGFTQASSQSGALGVYPQERGRQAINVASGQIVSFDRRSLLAQRPQRAGELAWSHGMIVAQGQRLADFLTELGRYRRGHLGCDPSLGDLRVSGTFPLHDTDQVLLALSETFNLDVQHLTRYWVTLKARPNLA